MKSLIDKTYNFLKRIIWKAFFYDNPSDSSKVHKKNYGFPSEKSPPQNKDLIAFENDMYNLIKNIEYKTYKSEFQQKLTNDINEMRNSKEMYVPADKTTNIYKISKDKYKQLLNNNITTNYRKN